MTSVSLDDHLTRAFTQILVTTAVIVAASRTPVGFSTTPSNLATAELRAVALKHASYKCNVSPEEAEEIFFENVV